MEIRHFKLIVTVARLGSLTKAAEELFLSQPALSHQLKEIENELGVKVFKRENNRMTLTPEGEIIKRHSQDSLNSLDSLHKHLNGLKGEKTTALRLCIQNYNSYHWIGPIIERFNNHFPSVEIEIITESTQQPLELLKNNQLDLTIMHSCPLDTEFKVKKLITDELIVLLNNNHPLAHQPVIQLDDLKQETLILNSLKGEVDPLVSNFINILSLDLKKIMYMNLTDNIVHMVRSGYGLSILPKWIVCPLAIQGLTCVPITPIGIQTDWYSVTKTQSDLNQNVLDFLHGLIGEVLEEKMERAFALR